MIKILKEINTNKYNTQSLKRKHTNLPIISTVISALINVAKEFGELKKTYYSECDMEIVDFAIKNNVLAVVSDDTDFLIFEGNWKFWSANDINMENMTTMEYNKRAIREQINLSDKQMPLFATIYGNEFLAIKKMGTFDNVTQYIREFPVELEKSDIQKIVNDIYEKKGRSKRHCTKESIEKCVKDSLKSYKIGNIPNVAPLEDELLTKAFNDVHGYIFEILEDLPIKVTLLYFDYRKNDFKNYFDSIKKLICRQMGVLLKHKNDPELTRTIITKKSHGSLYEKIKIKPEYPKDIEIPPLIELLVDTENNEQIRLFKFKLLWWMVLDNTEAVKPEELATIPKEYLITVLTLIYLLQVSRYLYTILPQILRGL